MSSLPPADTVESVAAVGGNDNVSKELTSHSDTAAGEDDTRMDPCSRKRCRDTIQHLQESIAARECSIKEYEKIDHARKKVTRWRWLCSPQCTTASPYSEHVNAIVSRESLLDKLKPLQSELAAVYSDKIRSRFAFLENGTYESQGKDAHIIAVGHGPWDEQSDIEFAPLHYDVKKKAWIDLSEEEWDAFVWFSSYGKRLVRIQPNPSPRRDVAAWVEPFQITEYEVDCDGELHIIRMWKRFRLWEK